MAESLYLSQLQNEQQKDYLRYRFSGFSHDEALQIAGVDETRVEAWNNFDPQFSAIAQRLEDPFPQQVSIRQEILATRFSRNLALVLDHDYEVLAKARGLVYREVKTATGETKHVQVSLTPEDRRYLEKIRAYYSGAEALNIEKVVKGELQPQGNLVQFINNFRAGG